MDPFDRGRLYDTFLTTSERWADRPAYAVPPMAGRSYHPDGKEYTWRETAVATEALRRRYERAGYGHGHRIAILFEQRPEFMFHWYALNALGVGVAPINPDYRRDEIAYLLDHSEASLVLAPEARLAEVGAATREIDGRRCAAASFEDDAAALPEARSAAPHAQRAPDGASEAALLYTSGTTGRPKGCVLTNEYFHTYGAWYVSLGGLLTMREGRERMYNPLPLHHANCLSISAPAMLLTGGCLVFPDRFHASTWWRDLVACKVTAVHFQGIIPNVLLKLPVTEDERRHEVRFALCAGVEPSQHEPFEKRFGFPLVEMWAMTETGRLISDNVEPRLIHTRCFGKPAPGLQARVVDEHDREQPTGTPGEFCIRHSEAAPRKGFFSEYLKNPEATATAWRGGWYHTGDVAVRDAEGRFFFVDRAKHIIRRSGENIAAAEVEACLVAHDKVKQAAVFPVRDQLRDEEVMACIVVKDPADAGEALAHELTRWCLERIAYFKAPAWLRFIDAMPTNTSAKLQKNLLYPPGNDPQGQPGVFDLRSLKKKQAT